MLRASAALSEVERVDALRDRWAALYAATLTARAFHDPKQLRDAESALVRAEKLPVMVTPAEALEASAAVLEMEALAERIARRKRRQRRQDG